MGDGMPGTCPAHHRPGLSSHREGLLGTGTGTGGIYVDKDTTGHARHVGSLGI